MYTLKDPYQVFRENIASNMTEGVMIIGFDGIIRYVNFAACKILGFKESDLDGQNFGPIFIEDPINDAFSQMLLDAIYDNSVSHKAIVPYHLGERILYLRVVSSFIMADNLEKTDVILVISDLSELMELRDSVRSMEKIKALNDQLEMRNKLISETFGRFLSDDIERHLLDTPE